MSMEIIYMGHINFFSVGGVNVGSKTLSLHEIFRLTFYMK